MKTILSFCHSVQNTFFRYRLLLTISALAAGQAHSQTAFDYGIQVGNGFSVGALLRKGDTMFVGGDMDYVGTYTGSLVGGKTTDDKILKNFPVVNGTIKTIIPDGSGGWFIGGSFTRVAGYARKGFARITPAKQLDLTWALDVNDGGRVDALLLSITRDTLWVGGTFSSIAGVAKDKLAAVKVPSRSVISTWGPRQIVANWWPGSGTVTAIVYQPATSLSGDVNKLIIGGDFGTVVNAGYSWLTRKNMAALNPADGEPLNWIADVEQTGAPVAPVVRAFALNNVHELYIGGLFSKVTDKSGASLTVQSLAKLNAYTDTLHRTLFNVDLQPKSDQGLVNSLKIINWHIPGQPAGVTSRELAIGGKFTGVKFGGGTVSLFNFTVVSTITGEAKANDNFVTKVNGKVVDTINTNPGVYGAGEVYTFEVVGSKIFIGGDFEGISTAGATVQVRRNLAAFDANTPGIDILPWTPIMQTNLPVRALLISGTDVMIGGDFTSAGGVFRKNLAAVDLRMDTVLAFNPKPDSYVNAFVLSKTRDTLYVGGNFTNIGSVNRGYTAAIDLRTLAILPWGTTGGTGGGVQDLKLDTIRNLLYVGGKFATLAGKTRRNLAALNSRTGMVVNNWIANIEVIDPNYTPVRSLEFSQSGDTLFVGGRFNQVNTTQSRRNLAAFKTALTTGPVDTTATLLAWSFPVTEISTTPDIGVNSLVRDGNRLYLGGKFSAVKDENGVDQPRTQLALLNLSLQQLDLTFKPLVQYGGVNTMQIVNNSLYLGGDFGTVSGVTTSYAAAINKLDGSPLASWQPYPTKQPISGQIEALLVTGGKVYLGGSHENMTEAARDAVFHLSTVPSLPGDDVTLPIKLNSFTGTIRSATAVLDWTVSEQTGLLHFIIERSADGSRWNAINTVLAKEGSIATYNFTDYHPLPGNNFYRLRLVAASGAVSYSRTLLLQFANPNELPVVFPTLITKGYTQLVLPAAGNQTYTCQLFDSGGRLLQQFRTNTTITQINLAGYRSGIYVLQIRNTTGEIISSKLTIP